jgi:hypothetical protein
MDKIRQISTRPRLEDVWKVLLIIYFIVVITVDISFVLQIWNPETQTKVQIASNNVTLAFVPKQITNREVYLIEISALFGVLGASTYGLASATVWIANNKLKRSWILWYISHPFVGGALATIFYLILRGALIQGISFTINDFSIAAVSAIVGLITTQAMKKLRDIFDTLFGISKSREERGDEPDIRGKANVKLSAAKTTVKISEESDIKVDITKNNGTYADNIEVSFSISNPEIAAFKDGHNKVITDSKGLAFVTIKGLSRGDTTVTATSSLDGENIHGNINIEVVDQV